MINYINYKHLYANFVVEVKVIRRNEKENTGPTRRFLCTNSRLLLNSPGGRSAFHFSPPTHPNILKNPAAYNLITVYDLLKQDYRNVNLDTDKVLAAIPVSNREDIAIFWEYFNSNIAKWSSSNKDMFMNL